MIYVYVRKSARIAGVFSSSSSSSVESLESSLLESSLLESSLLTTSMSWSTPPFQAAFSYASSSNGVPGGTRSRCSW
jgi:hypothetical protein